LRKPTFVGHAVRLVERDVERDVNVVLHGVPGKSRSTRREDALRRESATLHEGDCPHADGT